MPSNLHRKIGGKLHRGSRIRVLSIGTKIADLERHDGRYFVLFHRNLDICGPITSQWLKLDLYTVCIYFLAVCDLSWYFQRLLRKSALKRGTPHAPGNKNSTFATLRGHLGNS